MSKMQTVIERVVKEDVSNHITQMDVLYEAIINSIHAGASRVICRLTGERQELLRDEVLEETDYKKVIAIDVEDNGVGFNNENYKSFGDYRSDYKIDMGCKGVGRFVFLKLFSDVSYTSWLEDEQVKRSFNLTFDFESEDLSEMKEEVEENRTRLRLKEVSTEHFSHRYRHVDRRMDLNLSEIKKDVLLHLIPTLYFCKKEGSHVEIVIEDILGNESATISEDDIPDFETTELVVKNKDGEDIPFSLHHFVEGVAGKVHAFYCANRRTVCTFESQKFSPQGFNGTLLLESEALNEAIDNFRDDFDIYPVQTDMFHSFSWEMINRELKTIVSELVQSEIPNVEEKNRAQLQEIQDERPYLVQYIDEEDIKIAGFISKQQIIKRAKKRFDTAKDNLLKNIGKPEYSDEELAEAIKVTQNELVAYVQDRVAVIEQLKTMMGDKEKTESVIHNLFMEKYTDDDECNYFDTTRRNNLWLLDDRFTSYSYAASDKMIKDVLDQVGSDYDGSKPDLSLFFSQSPENKKGLKSVIVEIKSFDDSKKYANKKFDGLVQLRDYIKAFKEKEEIESVWAFLITDVDDRFSEKLIEDDFKPLFSTQTPVYHRYFKTLDTSIYVVGAESLICDAEARNKVFIEIINKQKRLESMLDKNNSESLTDQEK